ncbi:MAG: zinc metalloprotease HtpX [Psychrilyobacter sp.]|uniref:zinc metalloprotease HtpX n=1 Tax=Psychrilyobacter sp. TaxID=2586924 RepID=UPI003C73C0C2
MNAVKTFLLMITMTLILLFIGGAIGGRNGAMFALIFSFGMNMISYWNSDKIVLRMYKAHEVEKNSEVYSIVRELSERADLPIPKVYMINQSQPNAFATGRNQKHAAVAVTRGITEILDRNELKGVLAHELGHVHNKDILIGTIAASFAGAIAYLATMAKWAAIFGGRDDEDKNPIALIGIAIFAPMAAMLVQMAISRTREYKADRYGGKLAGNPIYLANALKKLETWSTRTPMDAKPATAHMFIVNPLKGEKMAKLFSTHPSTKDRIAKLEEQARHL